MVSLNYHYNVAIIGMTSVGKSTLLNYLYGEKVAKTGLGKPVTTDVKAVLK
jgi:GTPase Era involved in 16S rRNA processing